MRNCGAGRELTCLLDALARQRLVLYRQPILPLQRPEQEASQEVLLRLLGPRNEPLAPGRFLVAAEHHGLMPLLDRWVVRTLFRGLTEIPVLRPLCQAGGRLFINLSGASLNEDGFFDFLLDQFEEFDVAPQRICFEVTESVGIVDLPRCARRLGDLRGLGCRLALDDFGRGMSSFAYLRRLPLDYLKIDGGFVRRLGEDPVDRAIVGSFQRVAATMGLEAVAEWVESAQTLAALKDMGITMAQGFHPLGTPEPLLAVSRGVGFGVPAVEG